MADYNLGRAHGKITIDTDVDGVAKTTASMTALEAEAKKLERAFKDLNKEVNKTETSHIKQRAVIHQSVRDHGNLTRSVIANQQAHKNLSRTIIGMSDSFTNMHSNMRKASTAFMTFARTVERMQEGGKVNFLEKIMGADRIARAKAQMGELSKMMLTVGANVSAISAVFKLFTANWTKFTSAITGTAAWKKMSQAIAGVSSIFLATFPGMNGMVNKLKAGFSGLALTMAAKSPLFNRFFVQWPRFASNLKVVAANFVGLTSSLGKVLVGTGVARVALSQLGKAAVVASAGFWALGLAASSIRIVGTAVMGLVDMVKQLSGAVLLLPGAFMTVGSVIGTVVLGMQGIKDAVKAAFEEDPKKWAESMLKLSPTMRTVSNAIREVKPALKDLRDSVQDVLLKGFDQDIKQITQTFLPGLKAGMVGTAQSIRGVKDAFVDWLASAQNVDMMNQSFVLTQQILDNVAKALAPLMHALAQVALVGQEALASMSTSWEGLAVRFDRFMATARQTGKLRMWIDDAVQGVKDLGKIFSQTGQLLGTFFRQFGSDGENALARLANTMTRWNTAVKQSAGSGGLRQFSEAVQRISGKGLELLHGAFIRVRDLITSSAPTIEKIFNAFTQSFNFWSSNFIKGYGVIEGFITIIKTLQLERVVGWLTAFIAIQKVMGILAGPVKAFVAGMAGIGTALGGVISGIKPMISTLGAVNNQVALMPRLWTAAKTTVAGFGKALWGAVGGGVGAALIGVVVAVTLAVSYFNNLKNGAKDLAEATYYSRDALLAFNDAYKETGGLMGKPVLQAAIDQFKRLREQQQAIANDDPSFWDNQVSKIQQMGLSIKNLVTGNFGKVTPWSFVNLITAPITEEEAKLEKAAAKAKKLTEELNKLGLSDQEVGDKITGTNVQWDQWIANLEKTGEISKETIDLLKQERDAFVRIQQAMLQVGPGPVNVAKGLEKIRLAAGDTETKLEGLKQVLMALGLIQDDTANAADDLAAKYWELTNTQVDAEKGLGSALIENNKLLIDRFENAKLVKDQLKQIRDDELRARAAAGQDQAKQGEITSQRNRNIEILAQKYGLTPEELLAVYQNSILQADPLKIQTILAPGGPVTDQVKNAVLEYQKVADNQPIKIPFATQEGADFFKSLGIQAQFDAQTQVLTLPPFAALTPQQRTALNQRIQDGVNESPTGVKLNPSLEPGSVQKAINDNLGGKPAQVQVQVVPDNKPQINPPSVAPPKPISPSSGGASGPYGLVPAGGAKGYPIRPSVPLPGLPGQPQQQDPIAAMQQISQTVNNLLAGLANQAFQSGASIVRSLANGMSSAISQAISAITRVVKAVSDRLPHSPAKAGPFSGTGAPYSRGAITATDYAKGIVAGSSMAVSAGGSLAQGVVQGITIGGGGVLGGATYGTMNAVGDLRQLADFSRHIFDLFKSMQGIADTLMNFAQDMDKKFSKEGFSFLEKIFPRSYTKTVSDSELAAKRAEAAQSSIPNRADRNNISFDQSVTITGTPSTKGVPGSLGKAPTKQDIVDYIVAKGQREGLTPAQIQTALAIANQESAFDPGISGGVQGGGEVVGLYQQKYGPGSQWAATRAEAANPEHATNSFYEQYKKNLAKYGDPILAATLTQNPQLLEWAGGDLNKVKTSDYYLTAVKNYEEGGKLLAEASDRFTQALQSQPTSIGAPLPPPGTTTVPTTALPTTTTPLPNVPQRPPGPAPAGMTWDAKTGTWKPVGQVPYPTTTPVTPTTTAPVTIDRTSILNDTGSVASQQAAVTAASVIAKLFPQITAISGSRDTGTAPGTHDKGLAIDVAIPGWDTATGKQLGNQINSFLQANAAKLGIRYTIWDAMFNPVGGQSRPYSYQGPDPSQSHRNHIDVQFNQGVIPNISELVLPSGVNIPGGLALAPGMTLQQQQAPDEQRRKDEANQQILIDLIREGNTRGLNKDDIAAGVSAAYQRTQADKTLDPLTEAKKYWDAVAKVAPGGTPMERGRLAYGGAFGTEPPSNFYSDMVQSNRAINDYLASGGTHIGAGTLDMARSNQDLATDWLDKNPQVKAAFDAINNPTTPDGEITSRHLPAIDAALANIDSKTPEGAALKSQLETQKQSAMDTRGITQTGGPEAAINAISQFASGATSVAEDIFGIIDSTLNSISGTKNITGTLARGISNTKDITTIIDGFQNYLELAAKIAQTVGDVSGMIAGIVGAGAGADPSGGASGAAAALSAVSTISSVISAVISGINSTIDLIQEGAAIAGKYLGRALTSWLGFPGIGGDIKFLLDTQEGVLKAYSSVNPQDKHEFSTLGKQFGFGQYSTRQALVNNQLNVFGSPGMSAGELMDQSMWQVRTAGVGVFGYSGGGIGGY